MNNIHKKKKYISSPLDHYRRAISLTDEDSVHDVLAREGPQILKKGLPFIVTAARWRKKDELRKVQKRSQREVSIDQINLPSSAPSIWDAYTKVKKKEILHVILDELSKMDDESVLVVWDHFMGYSDKEIKKKWIELSFKPENPSLELIRKRRQRALESIKKAVFKKMK